jgi:hypothetical protein
MDNRCQQRSHLQCNRKSVLVSFYYLLTTYIGNIQYEDCLPNQWDSDTLVCVKWSDKQHPFHRDLEYCKGLSIDYQYKLCCRDIQCHDHIPLF